MPAWEKATGEEIHNYTAALHNRLMEMKSPASLVHCEDTNCEDVSHDTERDGVVLDVLCAIVETSYSCLPLTGKAGGPGLGQDPPGPGLDRDQDAGRTGTGILSQAGAQKSSPFARRANRATISGLSLGSHGRDRSSRTN